MRISREQLEAIGRELVAYRALGVTWKLLEHRYGYGRTRLWMLWRDALVAQAGDGSEQKCS